MLWYLLYMGICGGIFVCIVCVVCVLCTEFCVCGVVFMCMLYIGMIV